LSTIEGLAVSYTENDAPVIVTGNLSLADVDDTNIEAATVSISGNFAAGEDVLGFTDQLGISGTYNNATEVLTLTGTAPVSDYQTAIRSVTYNNTSDNPSTLTRTISFTINDGALSSNTLGRAIDFSAVNDAPVLSTIEGVAATYTENDAPIQITNTMTLLDVDDALIESASVMHYYQL
jgi:hypothetical protein